VTWTDSKIANLYDTEYTIIIHLYDPLSREKTRILKKKKIVIVASSMSGILFDILSRPRAEDILQYTLHHHGNGNSALPKRIQDHNEGCYEGPDKSDDDPCLQ
jgi:hypothetical protein